MNCSAVWGSIGVVQFERLQKLQNRALRLITSSDLNVRSSTLLGDLGWDSLEGRRSKQLAVILFKALHNLSPTCLNSIFRTTSSVHSHNLRNSKYNLFVPKPSTEAGPLSALLNHVFLKYRSYLMIVECTVFYWFLIQLDK